MLKCTTARVFFAFNYGNKTLVKIALFHGWNCCGLSERIFKTISCRVFILASSLYDSGKFKKLRVFQTFCGVCLETRLN